IIILTTCPSMEIAKNLSTSLVTKKLAACVSIIPKVLSIFFWNGKIVEDTEALMVMKTTQLMAKNVINFIKTSHPYDVPEVLTLAIKDGNSEYMKWIHDSVEMKSPKN
ncbi:predicted protein, partial [Nematostella vectensis]